MQRIPVALLATAVLVFIPLAAGRHAAAPVSPTLFVSTTGSDSGSCTRTSPCQTLGHAYRVARPGQVVEIAAGSYPYQEIDEDSSKSSAVDVVFQPAPGANVWLRTVAIGNGTGNPAASHITVKNIRAGEMQAFTPARDLTWVNIDAGNFYIRGVQHMLIKGGDWGPCGSRGHPDCGGNSKIDFPNGEQANDDITVDGAFFHDYRIEDPTDHFECVFLAGGTHITIRNSRFVNCEYFDVFAQYFGGSFAGLKLQRNRLGRPWNGQGAQDRATAIELSPRGRPFTDVLISGNSFADGTTVAWNDSGDGAAYSNVRAVANIVGTRSDCYPSVTFAANIWRGGACGATDRAVPLGYTATDGVLKPTAAAATVKRLFAEAATRGKALGRVARDVHLSSTTVRRILADKAYLGGIYGAVGAHPPLVTPARWRAAQRLVR